MATRAATEEVRIELRAESEMGYYHFTLITLPLPSKAVVVRCVGLRQTESKTGTELPHAQMRRVLKI